MQGFAAQGFGILFFNRAFMGEPQFIKDSSRPGVFNEIARHQRPRCRVFKIGGNDSACGFAHHALPPMRRGQPVAKIRLDANDAQKLTCAGDGPIPMRRCFDMVDKPLRICPGIGMRHHAKPFCHRKIAYAANDIILIFVLNRAQHQPFGG